jgi:hypothetical protein
MLAKIVLRVRPTRFTGRQKTKFWESCTMWRTSGKMLTSGFVEGKVSPDSPLGRLLANPMRASRLEWTGVRPGRRAAIEARPSARHRRSWPL